MQVDVVPLTDFVHGSIQAHEGRSIELEQGMAEDLERAGLVRIKMAGMHANKMMPQHDNKSAAGKAPDAGEGQPSSASLAAQALQPTTLHVSAPGSGKPRKTGM